jgi:hypothetical protein
MTESSPWDNIKVPNADFNVRQVDVTTFAPCYWGRDIEGACLFIMELAGDHTVQYRKNVTTLNGIEVDLRSGAAGSQRLLLSLEQHVDRDLFEGFCHTLVTALTYASDSSSSLSVALAHIRRWKTFLSGRIGHHLSIEEIRGLFAELTFLFELLERWPTASDAITAWLGPEKSHQDFIFGNTAVEIKALSGTERSTIRISSEDQLESLNDALFLKIYRLSSLPESSKAQSLNEIVAKIQGLLSDIASVEAFDRKLVTRGYAPLPEYDEPHLVVSDARTFQVTNGFPRLIRSELLNGITKVSYDIQIETIAPFQCDGETIFGGD